MKKIKIPFQGIHLIIVFIFLVGTSSCDGQKNKTDSGHIIKKSKTTSFDSSPEDEEANNQNTLSSFQLSNFDNQISDVVRTVFQDSKGNIWFGTQNGAFRQNGKTRTGTTSAVIYQPTSTKTV